MTRRAWLLLFLLAAIWGASYLFIKVGLEDMSPAMIVFVRLVLGALVLAPVAMARRSLGALRGHLGIVVFVAIIQVAVPFLLITFGEQRISSALTGILVSASPIFTALIAIRFDAQERSRGWGAVGIALGILGVAVLLGLDVGGDRGALTGALMVVLAAVGYAVGGLTIKRRLHDVPPVANAAATLALGAVAGAPFAIADPGGGLPGLVPAAAVLALGLVGTGAAFLIFYTLIADVGPARASLVTYIVPGFAVVYGMVLLDERVTAATIFGIALILGGSWLAAGGRPPFGVGRTREPAAVVRDSG